MLTDPAGVAATPDPGWPALKSVTY